MSTLPTTSALKFVILTSRTETHVQECAVPPALVRRYLAEKPHLRFHEAVFEDGTVVSLLGQSLLRKAIYNLLPKDAIPINHRIHDPRKKCFICLVYGDHSRSELIQAHQDNGVDLKYVNEKYYEPDHERVRSHRKKIK